MAENCANCDFYSDDEAQVRAFGGLLPGICRKNPPAVMNTGTTPRPMFPPCRPDTWCGAWTAK